MAEKKGNDKNLPNPKVEGPLLQYTKQDAVFDSPEDVTGIIEFLENFQKMLDPRAQHPQRLISIKMPVPLLEAFKARSKLVGIPYQTLIKKIMLEYLHKSP